MKIYILCTVEKHNIWSFQDEFNTSQYCYNWILTRKCLPNTAHDYVVYPHGIHVDFHFQEFLFTIWGLRTDCCFLWFKITYSLRKLLGRSFWQMANCNGDDGCSSILYPNCLHSLQWEFIPVSMCTLTYYKRNEFLP